MKNGKRLIVKSELVELIGIENANKLSMAYGGTYIYIPKHLELESRNQDIKTEFTVLLNNGATCMNAYKTMTKEYDLSLRQVQQIIAT